MSHSLVTNFHPGGAERGHRRARTRSANQGKSASCGLDDVGDESDQWQREELRRAERVGIRRAADEAAAQRQGAIREQRRAAGEFAEQLALAYVAFLDFQTSASEFFVDHRDRVALGLTARVPVDAHSFVKFARGAYKAALAESRLSKLAPIGYDRPILQSALDNLERLLEARQTLVHAMAHTALVMVNSTNAKDAVVRTVRRSAGQRAFPPAQQVSVMAAD